MQNQYYFKPRARLLKQLGDQLIKDEGIALFELVKNAYDADATHVEITLNNVDKKNIGEIIIDDNGSGMNFALITEHWLEPGTDHKEQKIIEKFKSPLYGRLPLGEKGIGRFGSHKLGQIIEIVTKTDFDDEVSINIDWTDFDRIRYLHDTPITIIPNKIPKTYLKNIDLISKEDFDLIIKKTIHSDDILFLRLLYNVNNDTAILKKKFQVSEDETIVPEGYNRLKTILNQAEYFTSGTKIYINKLWNNWTKGMLRNTFRSVHSINSPFPSNISDFTVNISTDKEEWLESLMTPEKAIAHALFVAEGYIEDDQIHMHYEFRPWAQMEKLKYRVSDRIDMLEVPEEKYDEVKKKYIKKDTPFTLADYKIGRIVFKYYMYDQDTRTMNLGIFDTAGLKKLLKNSGGVRVYRDNIRVYDYGEPGTDWLKLDYQRFQTPGQAVSNNQILGAIYIHRDSSSDLKEKTNREGFVVNPAFETFIKAVSLSIKKAAQERNIDKEYIRDYYGVTAKSEPVINKVESLKEYVILNVTNEPIRNKINEKLDEIEKEYKEINEKIISAAGSGLALNVAIHEMEKIIEEMIKIVKEEKMEGEISIHVDNLYCTLKQYAQLAQYSVNKNLSLRNTLRKSIELNLYRLHAHDIEIENATEKMSEDVIIEFPEKLLLSSIANLFDNSIYWLEKKYTREKKADRDFKKKIYLNVTNDLQGGPAVIIADNGDGFQAGTDQLVRAFVGYKDSGMGLGLYIIDESMKINNGKLLFPESADLSLPKEMTGAIIALQFISKEKK